MILRLNVTEPDGFHFANSLRFRHFVERFDRNGGVLGPVFQDIESASRAEGFPE
jgi:hypothetical protein